MFEITKTTQPPESFSQKMHETVLANRDILNHVFEKYKETGMFPKLSKVKGSFDRDRFPAFQELIDCGVLREELSVDGTGNRLILTFSGFLYCEHKDARGYLSLMYQIFEILRQYYESHHEQFTLQYHQLREDIYPRTWKENEAYLQAVLKFMGSTPLSIISVNWSSVYSEIRVYESIYDFKDADEYFEKCYKLTRPRLGFTQERRITKKGCGLLSKDTCDQAAFIADNFKAENIFLDIPYHREYAQREIALRNTIEQAGLNPIVAKDKITSNDKLCKVCRLLRTCKYGIADISFDRHSVSYELGLLHAFGLSTCILLQESESKFGDIDGLEHQAYDGEISLKMRSAEWIASNVLECKKTELEAFLSVQKKLLEKGEIKYSRNENIRESQEIQDDSQFAPISKWLTLSSEAKKLILQTGSDPQGRVIKFRVLSGLIVQTNNCNFVESGNPRSDALWEAAVEELVSCDFLRSNDEETVFSLTKDGFQAADELKKIETT